MEWLSPLSILPLLCTGGSLFSYLTLRPLALRVLGRNGLTNLTIVAFTSIFYATFVAIRYSIDIRSVAQLLFGFEQGILSLQIITLAIISVRVIPANKIVLLAMYGLAAVVAGFVLLQLGTVDELSRFVLLRRYFAYCAPQTTLAVVPSSAILLLLLLMLVAAWSYERTSKMETSILMYVLGGVAYLSALLVDTAQLATPYRLPNVLVFGQIILTLLVQRAMGIQLSAEFVRANHLNQLRAQMMDKLSHELRTPLGVIQGYLDMLARGILGPLSDIQKTAVQTALESVYAEVDIVDDLLLSSYLDRGITLSFKSVDYGVFVHQAVLKAEQKYLSREIKISVETHGDMRILADTRLVSKILDKLLDNACKFSSDGGLVGIAVNQNPGEIRTTIRDSGTGFLLDTDLLLESFTQGNQDRDFSSGMGLGLKISYALIVLHGGELQLGNDMGHGFVEFTLPRSANTNPEKTETSSETSQRGRKSEPGAEDPFSATYDDSTSDEDPGDTGKM